MSAKAVKTTAKSKPTAKPVKPAPKPTKLTKKQPIQQVSEEESFEEISEDISDLDFEDEDDELEFEDDVEHTLTPEQEADLARLATTINSTKNTKGSANKLLKKVENSKVHPNAGVVYISHIPFGFYEHAMRKFFSQFGMIRKLRLSRSPRTGRYRGYGYIEFDSPEIAAIIADTMDGYMMFGKVIQCQYVPLDQLHPNTFVNHSKPFKMINHQRNHMTHVNKNRNEQQVVALQKNIQSSLSKTNKKLAQLGYGYSYDKPLTLVEVQQKELQPEVESDSEPEPTPAPVAKKARKAPASTASTTKRVTKKAKHTTSQ